MSARDGASPVELRVEHLPDGTLEVPADGRERVAVILGGTCSVAFGDGGPEWGELGERADVFDGLATAVYIPSGRAGEIKAAAGGVRLAFASAPAAGGSLEPYVVRPGDIRSERRGRGTWVRDVHDIVGSDAPAERLLVGETFSTEGVWSAYPPHRHDHHDPPHEGALDEAFLIRVSPPSGFGVLVEYPSAGGPRGARVVTDGEIFEVGEGFHSFVAAAGHRFYYLWALAGRERVLRFRVDPRDAWLLEEPAE
jgi:5-deoxy-glucuronate isomerase